MLTIHEETQKAIAMLVELGIAEGDNGEFKPNNRATRAHAAKLLVNFKEVLDLLLEKSSYSITPTELSTSWEFHFC